MASASTFSAFSDRLKMSALPSIAKLELTLNEMFPGKEHLSLFDKIEVVSLSGEDT